MSRTHLFCLPCLIVGGLLWAPVEQTFAQTPDGTGMIRVSDQPLPGDVHQTPVGSHDAQGYCPDGGGSYDNYTYYGGESCPNCPNYDYVHHGHCSKKLHQILDWFNPHGACTFSPGHGWAPPSKQPIYRQPVAYQKGFPDSWTGQPGVGQAQYRAPVYMPTDTTQLGYYYQQVPRWQRNPAMIPARPHPADWHVPGCSTGTCGNCQRCQSGYAGYGDGEVVYENGSTEQQGQNYELAPTPQEGAYPDIPPTGVDVPGLNPAVPVETTPGLEKAAGTPNLQPTS